MLHNIKQTQDILGVYGENNMMNNVYNLVQPQNLCFLNEKMFQIEENLQFTSPMDNFVPRTTSCNEQRGETKLILVETISPSRAAPRSPDGNHRGGQNTPPHGCKGRRDSHTPPEDRH